MFIYGPPGNGKTSIARAIGEFMNNAGGDIYVPYAFLAENNIITVFDQVAAPARRRPRQRPLEDNEATIRRLLNTGTVDARWVRIRRPVIVTGGELNLDMLDLRYNPEANYYQAPMHVKANGGVFLIDDFGRQLCSPKELLNRWILPLEDRHDFLTVASGKKFQVPFEQLIIFSTNLDPKDLVDDAFLRRIRHKVEIDAPARDDLRADLQLDGQATGHESHAQTPWTTCTNATTTGRSPAGQRLSRFAGDRAVDLPIPKDNLSN